MTTNRKEKPEEEEEEEYVGNVWGWKFSLWGLFIIVLLSFIMYYRHAVLEVPMELENTEEVSKDSIR